MKKKALALFLVLIIPILLASCSGKSQNIDFEANDVKHSAETDIPLSDNFLIQKVPLVDYVDVLRNSEAYDGQYISVAGRITKFNDDYSLYFNERLGLDDDGLGFQISLDHARTDPAVKELYSIGDYIVVEGVWSSGYFSKLQEARITSDSTVASDIASEFLDSWVKKREAFAQTSPIVDYMQIAENIDDYDGEYVRIAGQISSIGTNVVTKHIYFHFRDIDTRMSVVSIVLKGCPQEMQDLCQENIFVILSGKITESFGKASLLDCYIEAVGDEAENAFYNVINQDSPSPMSTPKSTPATPIHGVSADTIVYVSSRSNTIHSVHDCSGMKKYREMTIATADAKGYKYCDNCW